MKLLKLVCLALITAVAAFAYTPQDPLDVGRGIYFLKMNNERTRVMVVKFAPGQSIGMHRHPDHVVYVIEGGKIMIHEEGKDAVTMDAVTGSVLWLPAQAHSAKNVGKKPMRLLVVEIK